MTTTERYSKANAPLGRSDITTDRSFLPPWKQQLLERKAVNERIMRQSDNRRMKNVDSNGMSSGSSHESKQVNMPHVYPNLAKIYPARESTPDELSVDPQAIILPSKLKEHQASKRHIELFSPQPYKPTLRNSIANDAQVVEEAVVKVKENPFKYMEVEKQSQTQTRSASAQSRSPLRSEPVYINTKNSTMSDLNNSCDSVDSVNSSATEFTHVRSMFEQYSSPNQNFYHNSSPKPYKSSQKLTQKVSPSFSSANNDHRFSLPADSVQSINFVASHYPMPADKDGNLDIASEMPPPNTVSSLKSVWETKDTSSAHKVFKFRPRDKTPPPAAFRRLTSVDISSQDKLDQPLYDNLPVRPRAQSFTPTTKTEKSAPVAPTAVSVTAQDAQFMPKKNPIPIFYSHTAQKQTTQKVSAFTEVPKLENSIESSKHPKTESFKVSNQTSGTESDNQRDSVCVENYVPKFVHEYTSHRITSILNDIIRDSFSYRVIPKAVTHHQPSIITVTKSPTSFVSSSSKPDLSSQIAPSSLSKNTQKEDSSIEPGTVTSETPTAEFRDALKTVTNHTALDSSTPEVILIEKSDENIAGTSFEASNSTDNERRKERKSADVGIPHVSKKEPQVVETESASHPKILVFKKDPFTSNASKVGSKKVVTREEGMPAEIIRLEPTGLPVVTSFKEEIAPALTTNETVSNILTGKPPDSQGSKDQSGKDQLIIVVEPPPENLKSCINQRKTSNSRKLSFHEDVYVHEYPVVFWTSEEELRLSQIEEQARENLYETIDEATGRDRDGAPLASHEEDFFSPMGSVTDVTDGDLADVQTKDSLKNEVARPSNLTNNHLDSFTPSILSESAPMSPSDVNNNSSSQKKRAPLAPTAAPRSSKSPSPPKKTNSNRTIDYENENREQKIKSDFKKTEDKDESHRSEPQVQRENSLDDLVAIDEEEERSVGKYSHRTSLDRTSQPNLGQSQKSSTADTAMLF